MQCRQSRWRNDDVLRVAARRDSEVESRPPFGPEDIAAFSAAMSEATGGPARQPEERAASELHALPAGLEGVLQRLHRGEVRNDVAAVRAVPHNEAQLAFIHSMALDWNEGKHIAGKNSAVELRRVPWFVVGKIKQSLEFVPHRTPS